MTTDQPRATDPGDGSGHAAQVFRREDESWTIVFDGATCRLRDGLGLHYLAVLLTHPHEEISSLALERSGHDSAEDGHAGRVAPHDTRERARINVTRAIGTALQRIAATHPALGRHLTATIRTGLFCRYTPDPRVPMRWTQ